MAGARLDQIRKYEDLYSVLWRLDGLYFKDMGLSSRDIQNRLKREYTEIDGKWIEVLSGDGSDEFALSNWCVCYSGRQSRLPKNADGICRSRQKRIVIRCMKDKKSERNNLLHEMIHAYESILPEHMRQYLVIHLYHELSGKIDARKLMRMIDLNSHIDLVVHSPLFLLKSLLLDIRLRLPYGTIYNYGRTELFKE